MLVEVRVRLKGSLSRLLEIAKQGLEKTLSRFRGVERRDMVIHYVGILRLKEKGTTWLCYRVFVDSDLMNRMYANTKPTHIIWVK